MRLLLSLAILLAVSLGIAYAFDVSPWRLVALLVVLAAVYQAGLLSGRAQGVLSAIADNGPLAVLNRIEDLRADTLQVHHTADSVTVFIQRAHASEAELS